MNKAITLTVVVPFYDDLDEASRMIGAVERSTDRRLLEFIVVHISNSQEKSHRAVQSHWPVRQMTAANLPQAKNKAMRAASGELVLFLFPGIFPCGDAIARLMDTMISRPALSAIAGRWSNAKGKLEVGYNVRRFPTFTALMLDILLLNKVFPRNRFTRRYKMHDFDHSESIQVDHANDAVFMVRRDLVKGLGFNENYAPGWFDQVEFCMLLKRAGATIQYEPVARFQSNENVPLIDRLVEDDYASYRRAELRFVQNHFGSGHAALTRIVTAVGMVERLVFMAFLPGRSRRWFLSTLRSYVNDDYIRRLRNDYWAVLKSCFQRAM